MISVRPALQALDRAGVPFATRGAQPIDEVPAGGDVDILVRSSDLALLGAALGPLGFHPLHVVGHPRHRFYVGLFDGRWIKIDVNVVPDGWRLDPAIEDGVPVGSRWPDSVRADAVGRVGRLARGMARRRPVSFRRQGPVVAFLGPDGAGKGTVIEGIRASLPIAVTSLYLGRRRRTDRSRSGGRQTMASARSEASPRWTPQPGPFREVAFLLWKTVRDWRRLIPGYLAAWRGHVVLCDRHPIEVLAVRPKRTPAGAAVERFLVTRLLPWPDALIVLDAPAATLFQRKGEHTVGDLERWRRSYLEVFGPKASAVISTAGPVAQAVIEASEAVWVALCRRRRW